MGGEIRATGHRLSLVDIFDVWVMDYDEIAFILLSEEIRVQSNR
jgi:hypothetical protein